MGCGALDCFLYMNNDSKIRNASMKKILSVFGARPDAIKMATVVAQRIVDELLRFKGL